MSDHETRPIEPEAPTPPASGETPQPGPYAAPTYPGQPPYAMPLPAGYPAYAQPARSERPRFGDQVMGMWAVVAVALACLIVGGLGGFVLGRASGDGPDRFGLGPGSMELQGGPNGIPNPPNGFPKQLPRQSPQNPNGR